MKKLNEKNVRFAGEELDALIGDLIKIVRAFKDGSTVGMGELETVIEKMRAKKEVGKRYTQVVVY